MVTNMCLPARPIKLVIAAWLMLAALGGAARADDLSDFNRAVEMAMSHHRVALGHLRAGTGELAAMEVENFRAAWVRVAALPRPAAFTTEQYRTAMLEISTGMVGTLLVMSMGNAEAARNSLMKVRTVLAELRKGAKVEVLADCILDANEATAKLLAFRQTPDLRNPLVRYPLIGLAAAAAETLWRCDGMAPPDVRTAGEFRRLIDGSVASLAQVLQAIETNDLDLFGRLIRELQSFDNLLAFRYG